MKPLPIIDVKFQVDYNDDLFSYLNENFSNGHDAFSLRVNDLDKNFVVLNDPALIKYVLQTNNRNYEKGVGIDKIRILLGNGIMVSEGAYWRKQRRMIQPCFGKELIKGFQTRITEINERMIAQWIEKSKNGERIDLHEEMSYLTLNIILELIFTDFIDTTSNNSPFHILTKDSERDLRFALKFRSLHSQITEIISDRISRDLWPADFLTNLYQARSKDDGKQMTQKEIVDEVITLIVAGHETTASALTWCWLLLMSNDSVYQGLIAEARNEDNHNVGYPYTRMVLNETLRLYPPGWLVSRKTIEEDMVGAYKLQKGTDVLISLYSLHRDARFWKDGKKFIPERFQAAERVEDDAFLPFSTGPRKCIGDMLAMLEMETHLITASKKIKLNSEKSLCNVTIEPHINLRPKDNILVNIERI